MKRQTLIFAVIGSVTAAGNVGSLNAASTDGLIDPGWDDAYFEAYRALSAPDAAFSENTINFSLPVLGFRDALAGPDSLAKPLGERMQTALPGWPACAAASPKVVTIPANASQSAGLQLGTWFSSTYDFGCVQVVVEGDRNLPDRSLVPEAGELPESGTIVIAREDENAGASVDPEGNANLTSAAPPALGDVVISYTRGNLTYGITVSCSAEGASFCANNGALRALVGELVPVAGRPQP